MSSATAVTRARSRWRRAPAVRSRRGQCQGAGCRSWRFLDQVRRVTRPLSRKAAMRDRGAARKGHVKGRDARGGRRGGGGGTLPAKGRKASGHLELVSCAEGSRRIGTGSRAPRPDCHPGAGPRTCADLRNVLSARHKAIPTASMVLPANNRRGLCLSASPRQDLALGVFSELLPPGACRAQERAAAVIPVAAHSARWRFPKAFRPGGGGGGGGAPPPPSFRPARHDPLRVLYAPHRDHAWRLYAPMRHEAPRVGTVSPAPPGCRRRR